MDLSLIIKLSIPYFFENHLVGMALLNKDVMKYIIKISRHKYNDLLNHYPLLPIKLYAHRKIINPYGDTLFTNCSYNMDIYSLQDYYLYFNFTPKSKTRLQFRCYHSMDPSMNQDYDLLKTFKTDRGLLLRTYPMSRLDVNRLDVNRLDVNRIDINQIDVNRLDVNQIDVNRLDVNRIDINRLDVNQIDNQNEFKLILEKDYQILLVIKKRMIQQLCINQMNITFKKDLPVQRLALISNHTTLKMMESNILL